MLSEEESKENGLTFSKLTALSLCTHQLSLILKITEIEPGYSELH